MKNTAQKLHAYDVDAKIDQQQSTQQTHFKFHYILLIIMFQQRIQTYIWETRSSVEKVEQQTGCNVVSYNHNYYLNRVGKDGKKKNQYFYI